ncbi:TonB-system energizer ExbB [Suttonella ornithocola]|uniref:Biopolymer transport protein exbB n=1 Tax=Suttonella ornithocola TaxID=279832 RepID=A0A380MKJ4_9GAMM|nr:TonB-system energizer ExbB [Suttonella ornithocola]SUO93179.1 Biopolymer transport protein exbB [Suttonella ornithocola]
MHHPQTLQIIDFLRHYLDHIIIGILGLMSLIMLWKTLERTWFYARMNLADYADTHQLDIALERGLTPIYTIGANAPYVGLLGTVIGILITFYDIGQQGGQIDIAQIMVGLALALKATALGILVAIPSVIFYNLLTRKATVRRHQWQSAFAPQAE